MTCTRAILAAALVAATVELAVACEAVPDLRFDGDAGGPGVDGAPSQVEGGSEAGRPDAAGADAGDGGAAPICTTAQPSGNALCCGATTWCEGDCQAATCDYCLKNCTTGQACCGKGGGNALCKKTGCP